MSLTDGHPVDAGWQQLDKKVVEVTTWVAAAFALGMLSLGVGGGQREFILMTVNPAAIALAGWFMLRLRRPNVLAQLVVGMSTLVFVLIATGAGGGHDPLLAVLAMAVVGVLFSRRHTLLFAGMATVVIGAIAYLHDADAAPAIRAQVAFGAATTLAFITWLVSWVKARWLESNQNLEDVITSKDRLIASVSHELRTPMTSVVGLARELADRFDDFSTAEVRELLDLIVHESTDVANILEDLLVAARADVGKLSLALEPVDIYAEISTALNTTSSATITRHDPTAELLVAADPMRVRQILRNLIVNATRYGGPDVRVTVESKDGFVAVSVCDDGDPIPQDQREKIFLPYQGANGSTNVPGSVGLGLTVSRQLARLMGGDLTYDYLTGQSRFTFLIPACSASKAPDPKASALTA